MKKTRDDILDERRRLRAEYGELFGDLSALLFQHDTIGISYDINTDEYEPEAGTISPRLHDCKSADDVGKVVYEEFVSWFGGAVAGPPERYREVASVIWQLLQRY